MSIYFFKGGSYVVGTLYSFLPKKHPVGVWGLAVWGFGDRVSSAMVAAARIIIIAANIEPYILL